MPSNITHTLRFWRNMKYHQSMAICMLFLLLNSAPYSQAIDLLSAYQTVSEQIGSTISSILPEKKTTDLVDWKETPDAHYIMIDAPGLKNEDIKIVVEGNGMLKVTGERNKEAPKKKDIWHRRERYWWFYHVFEFKNNVDLDSVRAKLEDGVLTLFLEKLSPEKIRAPKVVKIVNPNVGDNLEDL